MTDPVGFTGCLLVVQGEKALWSFSPELHCDIQSYSFACHGSGAWRDQQKPAGDSRPDAQEYNRRKNRKGAFWEDRYRATAIDNDEHFIACLLYIDMNMVRAGAVHHPAEWRQCGLSEMLCERRRYRIIDGELLKRLMGVSHDDELIPYRKSLVKNALAEPSPQRRNNPEWSRALAVGSELFVAGIKEQMGAVAKSRRLTELGQRFVLKEEETSYGSILMSK